MPRIRTIKPEALQHRKVGRLSDRAFRIWVGMITQADDDGRLVVDPDTFRLLFCGYHPRVTSSQVKEAIHEVERQGLIRLYTVAGTLYADFPSWRDHQRIHRDHYRQSILPDPKCAENGDCGTDAVPIPDRYGTGTAGSEGKGSEGIGKETTFWSGAKPPDPRAIRAQAKEVLHFLNEKTNRSYREVDATLKPIEARLRSGVSVANCRGVIARKVREWGNDSKMAKYLRPETLFAASHFESYLGEREPEQQPHG